jgi:branched-chain amino acid transport system substrate-binding protein
MGGMQMKKGWVLLGSIVIAVGLLVSGPVFGQDKIKIGFIADMPGVGATFYKSQKEAIDLFIEETNAKGGILGKKLELVVRDAQLKPDVGATVARELVLNEKCDFLIGPTSSAVALAVTKVAKEFKKIIFFHTSNTEKLTTSDWHPYMFQVVPNTGIEARGIALYLSKKPYKKYSYIGPDYAYGHDQWNSFKEAITKVRKDIEILDVVWVKLGETNYGPFVSTLMSKNPEIIFSSLWGGASSSFVKQAKPYGLFKKATLSSLFDLDMLEATGPDMPEGMLGYARSPFYGINTPDMKAFNKKYFDKYKDWPADWAIMVYDGLLALQEGIKKANSVDSEKVSKVLGGLKWNSLRGPRYIRAEDHMANVGIYVGTTFKDPNYKKYVIMKDVEEVPAEKVWMSVDEIKKLRLQQK